ncbi:MAG: DCC1-like thiol-disulfide oxidoreductase family protein [Pseudomonadota bacterium]
MKERSIWLYDSVCILCDGAVRFTLAQERAPTINFVAIQSEHGRRLAKAHGLDPDDPVSFLFIENKTARTKSDAVIALAKHLKYPARLLALVRFIPRIVRDKAYDLIAQNRYKIFGKSETCLVPDAAVRSRFTV